MKVIIIGIDSGIGRALGQVLAMRGDHFVGTTRRHEYVAKRVLQLDLDNPNASYSALPQADVAFFCAAVTSFANCRNMPEVARRVNTTAPAAIATALVKRGTRVVLLSTSAVFDCRAPCMVADRPRLPGSVYGRTKADAEVAFLALGPLASVVRLTKVLTPDMKLFSNWIGTLMAGNTVRAVDDHRFCPIALIDVVQTLVVIAERREGGIYQMSGASDVSYADAARYIAGRLGAPAHLVDACHAVDLDIPFGEVTAYTSLDTARLAAVCGFAAPDPWKVINSVIDPRIVATQH